MDTATVKEALFNPVEIIQTKRDGGALELDELRFMLDGYVNGTIPEYQIAALLMAIYFQDMSEQETVHLTQLMRDSGEVVDLSHLPGPKIDKHSTGGVGDKVSLILAPLMAAAGVYVPMISGRSLGHTGGTLDKLDAIPGFQSQLPLTEFKRLTAAVGTCLIGQTREICPADRRLYALRDVTGTVQSMPLICGSILSKKLAEGLDALVLDVKVGDGAIFADAELARQLASRLINTARHFDLNTAALLTDMSQPLGRAIGNWVEVREAIQVLRGGGPEDVRQVTLALGALMLRLVDGATTWASHVKRLVNLLENGSAYNKFLEIVAAQGGEVAVVEHPELYPQPRFQAEIIAERDGFVNTIAARRLGQLCMRLGAGRRAVDNGVDPHAGIVIDRKVGDSIRYGEVLAQVQSSTVEISNERSAEIRQCFSIHQQRVEPPPLLLELLDRDGAHPVESV